MAASRCRLPARRANLAADARQTEVCQPCRDDHRDYHHDEPRPLCAAGKRSVRSVERSDQAWGEEYRSHNRSDRLKSLCPITLDCRPVRLDEIDYAAHAFPEVPQV